jgi:hypothetical protein
MGDITEAQPGVGKIERSARRLWIGVGGALLGVAAAVLSTFLTWIDGKHTSESASLWDLVGTWPRVGSPQYQDRLYYGHLDEGPHWTLTDVWGDYSGRRTIFTALPVIAVCCVAMVGVVGICIGAKGAAPGRVQSGLVVSRRDGQVPMLAEADARQWRDHPRQRRGAGDRLVQELPRVVVEDGFVLREWPRHVVVAGQCGDGNHKWIPRPPGCDEDPAAVTLLHTA